MKPLIILILLPRMNGVVPFAILDGHGSRIELTFLQYANDPVIKWCVCLDVPYGTALWQVGDSKEQNDYFNMVTIDAERQLLVLNI